MSASITDEYLKECIEEVEALYGDNVDINAFLSDLCKTAESKGYLIRPQQS